MTKLLILRGVPGCGKTTLATATGYEVVSRDDLRLKQFGDAEYFGAEGLITAVQYATIRYYLENDTSVVVDDTNVDWTYVKRIAGIGYSAGADVEIKVIDVPLSTALRRNRKRASEGGRNVPEDVIRQYHENLQKTKGWTL